MNWNEIAVQHDQGLKEADFKANKTTKILAKQTLEAEQAYLSARDAAVVSSFHQIQNVLIHFCDI